MMNFFQLKTFVIVGVSTITCVIPLLIFIAITQNLIILRRLKQIMSNQAEFDAKVEQLNAATVAIGERITNEAAEVRKAIEDLSGQGVDVSALDGVVERLNGIAEAVSGIYNAEPPTKDEPETEAAPASDE